MKQSFKPLFSVLVLAATATTFQYCNNKQPDNTSSTTTETTTKQVSTNSTAAADLHRDMRKLWFEHVLWTRNVIFCIIDGLPGGDAATKRLLKNQDDIGDAIKPVYGDAAGKKLTALLYDHITEAAELLKDAKKGDDKAFADMNEKWHHNADSIATFLSSANPNWPESEMKMMMKDHLQLTIDEAVARKKKDYDGDVAAYGKVQAEILKMSDMLADGIVKQYPDKFAAIANKNAKAAYPNGTICGVITPGYAVH